MRRLTLGFVAAAMGAAGMVAMSQGPAVAQAAADLPTLIAEGQTLYGRQCAPCHGATGGGGAGPALDGNSFMASISAVLNQIFLGNAERGMPMFTRLTDREVAAIANYIRNSMGNAYPDLVTVEAAAATRPTE
ncbi:MAG: cytochrome c [Bauldia sp.]|nr:cytochrome c [Bauldia sp.]MCW5716475.1 cytochrome c [Bauldia sp.]